MDGKQVSARITSPVFFSVQWTLASVCFIFLGFRMYVRMITSHRLYSDDYLAITAWILFVASNALWHTQLDTIHTIYTTTNPQTGVSLSADEIDRILDFLKHLIAFNTLFLCCLWSIKLSFLLFFRRLGKRLIQTWIKTWWWIVFVITIIALGVSFGNFGYSCSVGEIGYVLGYCETDGSTNVEIRSLRINTSMDILTDGLIITIPIPVLWNARLPTRKKLSLIAIFSLSILTMVFALIRLLVLPFSIFFIDLSWSFLWTNIEMGVAIMVACLGSFRQLYVKRRDKNQQGYVPTGSQPLSRHFNQEFFTSIRYIFRGSSRDKRSFVQGWLHDRIPEQSSHKDAQPSAITYDNGGQGKRNTVITTPSKAIASSNRTASSVSPRDETWHVNHSQDVAITINDNLPNDLKESVNLYICQYPPTDARIPLHGIRVDHSYHVESNAVTQEDTIDEVIVRFPDRAILK